MAGIFTLIGTGSIKLASTAPFSSARRDNRFLTRRACLAFRFGYGNPVAALYAPFPSILISWPVHLPPGNQQATDMLLTTFPQRLHCLLNTVNIWIRQWKHLDNDFVNYAKRNV